MKPKGISEAPSVAGEVTRFLLVVQKLQEERQRVQLLLADLSGLDPQLLQEPQHPAQQVFIWWELASALASSNAEGGGRKRARESLY